MNRWRQARARVDFGGPPTPAAWRVLSAFALIGLLLHLLFLSAAVLGPARLVVVPAADDELAPPRDALQRHVWEGQLGRTPAPPPRRP